MMMDIGMYGHTQHNGPYGSTDPSFYNYSPGENYPQSHGATHQGHQHYTSYNHGEDTPGYSTYGEGSDTSSSNQENMHYYHQPHHQHIQETNPSIISTESGLSYTNLDYSQSNIYPNTHQNIYQPNDFQRELMLQRHHQTEIQDIGHQNHFNLNHDSKYMTHQICENEGYAQVIVQNTSCMEYQHLHRYKEDPGMAPTDSAGDCSQVMHHRGGHHLRHLPPVPAPPSVPTYKWMQVKRNVPKPSGMYIL